jgi:hypothetical protein|tara:strand:+ start:12422 stop:12826 length:405 start_codon:yes stop_codon:yes gene_type:complete
MSDEQERPSDAGTRSEGGSQPSERFDGSRDANRAEQNRQMANDFRQMTQADRLMDRRYNDGAKLVAALDAVINDKYGEKSDMARNMREAAVEAVAQTMERGERIVPPQVKAIERDVEADHARATTRQEEADRER